MHYWNDHLQEAEIVCEAKWFPKMFLKRLKWEFLHGILYFIARINGYDNTYGQDFIAWVMEFKEDEQ